MRIHSETLRDMTRTYSQLEKDYVCNPATCNCENGKYLASIMDDSAIICHL